MPRELPPGYKLAKSDAAKKSTRELPEGYREAEQISTGELVRSDLAWAARLVQPLTDPLGAVSEYSRDPRTVRAFAAGLQNQPAPEGMDLPRKAAYYTAAIGPETAASLAFPYALGAPAAAGARVLKRGLARGLGAAEEFAGVPQDQRIFTDRPSALGVTAEGVGVGALNAAVGWAIKGVGILAGEAAPLVGQAIRATSGPKVKYAEAFAKDPTIIQRAIGAAGQGYEAFERYTGLISLIKKAVARKKSFSYDELENKILTTAENVLKSKNGMGPAPAPQELYEAAQAANAAIRAMEGAGGAGVNEAAKAGLAQGMYGSLKQSKDLLDEALEAIYPEYGSLRRQYFAERVAEEMGAILPKNANQSPNVLRTVGGAYNLGTALEEGDLLRAAGSTLISPAVWRTGIQGAYGAYKALPGVGAAAAALEGPKSLEALRAAYERRRLRPIP